VRYSGDFARGVIVSMVADYSLHNLKEFQNRDQFLVDYLQLFQESHPLTRDRMNSGRSASSISWSDMLS
jgi:hypothetical protein